MAPNQSGEPFQIDPKKSIAEILGSADLSDPATRAVVSAYMADREEARYQAVLAKAKQLGIPVRIEGPGHNVKILYDIREEGPLYRKTLNTNAAISTGANLLNKTPYGLNGEGMTVGVWDEARARTNHVELIGKVTVGDSTTANSDHGTHVAGTIAAKGVDPKAKGMGTNTLIRTYDWNNDYSEMTAIGAATAAQGATKLPVSNHSYGYNATAADMGRYETECNTLDALAKGLPYYLIFWAAGNEQQDYGLPFAGYQSITFTGLAKNIMTVGAANDAVTSGLRDVSKGTIANFSSMGPCDDGRIKPDIVANGVNVYSCVATTTNSYDGTYSGTSMATPNAAGTAALLVQLYKTNFSGQIMRASMLKALMIHTADDVGRPGPDYQYGWGYMNGKAAADLILSHKASLAAPKMIENSVTSSNKTRTTSFVWDGTNPIRATLVWTDVEGAAQTATNSRTRNLINDLDLKITAPDGTISYLPYVMPFVGVWTTNSMTNNAVTGTNKVDNVERVDIPAPTQPGTYTVTVGMYGTNALSGTSQTYSLIVTGGQNVEANPPPVVNITTPADGVAVLPNSPVTITATATDMAVGGVPGSVSKVEFFEGDTLLGEDTSAPYSYSWTPSGTGVRVLSAKATDNENASTVSSSVNVTVLVGDGTPTISSFSPSGGVAGDTVTINGNNLGNVSSVRFGSLAAAFVTNSISQLAATVPSSAITALITVSNGYGTVTSTTNFNILPIIFREDFSSITGGDSTTSSGSSAAWAGNTNFPSDVNGYGAGGAVKLGTSKAAGSITSRAINLAGNGGAFTLSFKVKGWSTKEGDIKVTAGTQSQIVSYTATMSGEFETKTVSFTGGTASTVLKVETTAKRAFIDDVVITAEAPSLPPVITSPTTAGGLAGQAFNYQITASNSPTSFGASNLPGWATINTTSGVISGATPVAGTNVVVVTASNSVGIGSNNLTITILPAGGGGTTNTIFSESFGTPTGTTNLAAYASGTAPATFQNKGILTFGSGEQANPADVRVTAVSSNYPASSGGGNIWFTTTSGAYGLSIEGINAATSTQLQLAYGYYKNSASAHATFSVDYWNGSAWVMVANTATDLFNESAAAGLGWYAAKALSLPAGAQINGLKLRFVKTGANAIRIDDVKLNGVAAAASPSISTSGSLSVVNTSYGTASTNPTSFTVSGANLAAGITVAPPAGFEVSASNPNSFVGKGNSVIVGSAGAVASTTVFVRLAADTDAGTYSGNIVCSSVGASNAIVATAASTVSARSVSVAANLFRKTYGADDPELTYNASESAPFSGALAREAGENVGVYAITQGDLTAGANYAILFTGNNFEITRKSLNITAGSMTKKFGQILVLGAGQTNFTSSGLVNGETIGSVTLTASGGTQAEDPVGTYDLIPSAATGGTFTLSNYSALYNSGTLMVLDVPTIVTIEDWAKQFPGLTDSTPAADPDGDGMSNLMEFFLGLDPTQSGGTSGPVMTLSNGPSNTLTMTYRRAKGVAGVSAGVQTIGDLSNTNWGTNGVQETVVPSADPLYEDVTVRVTNAPGETRKFMRLKVSQP